MLPAITVFCASFSSGWRPTDVRTWRRWKTYTAGRGALGRHGYCTSDLQKRSVFHDSGTICFGLPVPGLRPINWSRGPAAYTAPVGSPPRPWYTPIYFDISIVVFTFPDIPLWGWWSIKRCWDGRLLYRKPPPNTTDAWSPQRPLIGAGRYTASNANTIWYGTLDWYTSLSAICRAHSGAALRFTHTRYVALMTSFELQSLRIWSGQKSLWFGCGQNLLIAGAQGRRLIVISS